MERLNQLLAAQILAIAGALAGELAASDLLVGTAVVAFFAAFAGMFLQMTGSFLTELRHSNDPAYVGPSPNR